MLALVINLAKDTVRFDAMRHRLDEIGAGFRRLDAVNGHDLGEEEFRRFATRRPRAGRPWLRGQVGCLLSHQAAWTAIAAGSEPAGAVFEDDLLLSPDLPGPLGSAGWLPADADIVRLECASNRVLLDHARSVPRFGRTLAPLRSTAWCAGAYVVRRDTARRLLALPPSEEDSVDDQLFSHEHSALARRLRVYQFTPGFCIQRKDAGGAGTGWASNIDVAPPGRGKRLSRLLRRAGPGSLFRTLAGYRRVPFR